MIFISKPDEDINSKSQFSQKFAFQKEAVTLAPESVIVRHSRVNLNDLFQLYSAQKIKGN